ncbi:MAG: 3'(2'),5'-bisphosphate nucleotidase CysQ [Thermodesulfobacteriota bacterium]|nr:3'(2'),5'-bisphosphate nucleotidase CysQ [Thermodesulfobacteriota bacterium]
MLSPFLQERLVLSLLAAKKAGEAILAVYEGDIDVTYKEDSSPLTLADERAHRVIGKQLSMEASKKIPVLSEEGRHIPYEERKGWEYFWVVDPLDGTKEFIKRRGEFTVNIALMQKNKPLVGVVFVPARGFLYFAAEGIGAYKLESADMLEPFFRENGRSRGGGEPLEDIIDSAKRLPLDQFDSKSRDKPRVVGSRSHATKGLADFIQTVKNRYGGAEFIPAGSALKFGLVAEGGVHIYPRFGPTMEWDTAAGQCVVEQSGGVVLRLNDKMPLGYNKKDLRNPDFVCIGKHSRDLDHLLS